jgi:DNA-binding LytR/AlgR family response regulator
MKSKILFCDREMIIEEKNKGFCLNYCQIIDFSADKPYIRVSIIGNRSIYLETSFSELETQLPSFFFRCNRSAIVNLLLVTMYRLCKRKYILSTSFGKEFPVSIQNKKRMKELLFFHKTHNFHSDDCLFCEKAWKNFKINI